MPDRQSGAIAAMRRPRNWLRFYAHEAWTDGWSGHLSTPLVEREKPCRNIVRHPLMRCRFSKLVKVVGIEPTLPASKAGMRPLHYTKVGTPGESRTPGLRFRRARPFPIPSVKLATRQGNDPCSTVLETAVVPDPTSKIDFGRTVYRSSCGYTCSLTPETWSE